MQLLENRYFMVFVVLALVLFSGMTAAQDYGEAPMLTEMVEAGELPQVDERLPVEPLVVEGYDGIGEYGGTIRTTTTAPEGIGDDYLLMPFYAGLVQPHPETHELYPHLARDIEVSEDATTFTFHLREGLRWSDGEPYTADDIMFWYEDMLLNEDLTPVVGHQFRRDGETVEVTKVDDYTVEFKFAAPHPFFLNYLVHGNFHVRPKHYLTQFHIDYVSEEELLEAAREEGYELWYDYFWAKADVVFGMPVALDLPTVGPYMIVGKTAERRQFERNPYFWKVDTEGNQLPYIDRIDTQIVSDLEVIQGMIMSGAVDFVGYGTDLRNYPMYRSYEDEGGYRTLLWESGMGSEVILMVNQTHEDLALRELFQDKRVRQAISQAIDRDEINEVVYFGQGVPRQYTVLDTSQYYEPEFETAFIEYDPERANELLDEAGFDEWCEDEEWRLDHDGEPIEIKYETYMEAQWSQDIPEIAQDQWEDLGIKLDVEMSEFTTLADNVSEEQDFEMFNMAWSLTADPDPYQTFSIDNSDPPGRNSGQYHNERAEELMEKGRTTLDQEEREEIYEELFTLFNEDLPYLFVYFRDESFGVNNRVDNFEPSEFQDWNWNAHEISVDY